MALPAGVKLVTLTFGSGVDFLGNAITMSGTVTPSRNLVHNASGSPIAAYPFDFKVVDGNGTVPVPAVDQGGFLDADTGAPFSFWDYGITVTYRNAAGATKTRSFRVQPLQSQTSIDIDLLPSTETTSPPVVGTIPGVRTVNGQAGDVTVTVDAADVTIQTGDITDATPVGRNLVKASDQAAARGAIGAGVSNVGLGFTAQNAKPGNWQPAISEVTGLPDAIAEIPAADIASATSAVLGRTSGRRFASGFNANAGSVWGQRPNIFWNAATTSWPALTLPAGYTGAVIWNSENDPAATDPPAGRDGDLWDKNIGTGA